VRSPAGGGLAWSPGATPTATRFWQPCGSRVAELPHGAVLLAEDETHINLLPWVRSTWIAHGTRQRVMTPGTNRRRSIFGAVDLRTGRFLYLVARRAVSATFTAFLEQLLATYPAAPMVAVVCDNVIIHRSKIVQQWLVTHPRVRLLHGARYSPHDNPVERIWGALKASLANAPTLTVQGRIRQVHAFFRARAPAEILATAAPHSSPWLPDGYMQNFRQAALGEPVAGLAAAGGSSQRRWARASRAARRPRSWPRTKVIAGWVSERASSKPRSSTCSPITSPSRQQPMTAWATWSGSMPTLGQVS
jgi:transposase